MFVDYLLNSTNAPLLERMATFASARHRLIAENVVNLDTPGYRQKDLDLAKFRALLRDRVEVRRAARNPAHVRYDDIDAAVEHPARGILFHDGQNRSLEQLMTDQAKNALMHNLVVELLRKQFGSLENALKERLG